MCELLVYGELYIGLVCSLVEVRCYRFFVHSGMKKNLDVCVLAAETLVLCKNSQIEIC
jgi:hypothetical protein